MRVLILILTFTSLNSLALGGEKEEAMKGIQKAVLAYPTVKKYKRALEKSIVKQIPLEKETVGVIGGLALSASRGYVDTKVIKRMNIKVVGGDMRPNIRWDFKNNEANATFNINWSFQ